MNNICSRNTTKRLLNIRFIAESNVRNEISSPINTFLQRSNLFYMLHRASIFNLRYVC